MSLQIRKQLLSVIVGSLGVVGSLGLLAGCGSDNKNDSPVASGTAFVDINANPDSLSVGDATLIVARVDDVKDDAIILKIRFPTGMSYLPDSSYIEVNGEDIARAPDIVFTSQSERRNYVVYFLNRAEIDDEDNTRVSLQLVGNSRVTDGRVEIDADLDNPIIANDREFTSDNPLFDAEADTFIEVK